MAPAIPLYQQKSIVYRFQHMGTTPKLQVLTSLCEWPREVRFCQGPPASVISYYCLPGPGTQEVGKVVFRNQLNVNICQLNFSYISAILIDNNLSRPVIRVTLIFHYFSVQP
jgi:hypothetical protein